MRPVRFGTEGWRAVLADDFTFERVRAVARAAGQWLQRQPHGGPVAVGHDTRFMGDRFAAAAADELAACGLQVRLCSGPLPTPAVGLYVVQKGLAGAVILTSSHNTAEYNGIKVKGPGAASVAEADATWIGEEANRILAEEPEQGAPQREHARFEVRDAYVDHLISMVDKELIRRARLTVVADLMHGSGGGYFDEALRRAGCAEVRAVRGDADPTFEWKHPEPIGPNLLATTAMTADPAVAAGVATDGDADRFGMMAHGEYVDVMRAIVFLLYHLLKHRRWIGPVARAVNVTFMLDRLCDHYGVGVIETGVGFKHIAPKLTGQEKAILGVEESGGFGFQGHIPDRDGSLAALLACEGIAAEGKPVREILEDIFRLVGGRLYFGRLDVHLTQAQWERLTEAMPTLDTDTLAGRRVARVNRLDGAKFIRADDAWALIRVSGTELLSRIYAEGRSKEQVRDLLEAGRQLVGGVTGG